MANDPADEDVEIIVDHMQREAIASGHPPIFLDKWRAGAKRLVHKNERIMPGYSALAADALRRGRS